MEVGYPFISARPLDVRVSYLNTISKLLESGKTGWCLNSVEIEERKNNMYNLN